MMLRAPSARAPTPLAPWNQHRRRRGRSVRTRLGRRHVDGVGVETKRREGLADWFSSVLASRERIEDVRRLARIAQRLESAAKQRQAQRVAVVGRRRVKRHDVGQAASRNRRLVVQLRATPPAYASVSPDDAGAGPLAM